MLNSGYDWSSYYGAGGDNCLVKVHWVPTEGAEVVPQGFSEEVTFELKPK